MTFTHKGFAVTVYRQIDHPQFRPWVAIARRKALDGIEYGFNLEGVTEQDAKDRMLARIDAGVTFTKGPRLEPIEIL